MRRIQRIVDGVQESLGVDDPPVSSDRTPWSGFLIEKLSARTEPVGCVWLPSDILMIHTGPGRVRYGTGRTPHDYRLARGTVFVCPRHYEIQSPRVEGERQRIVVELSGPLVGRLFGDDRRFAKPNFLHLVKKEDKVVSCFIDEMLAELDRGCPSGPTFSEYASLSLLSYLRARYSGAGSVELVDRRLSAEQLSRVSDWVRSHLDSEISLAGLAALLGQSPFEFARMFKKATGLSPHRFVMQERIRESERLLREKRLPLAEIGLAVGFCNQSHFTYAFRRAVGTTPGRYQLQATEG
ncbi:AraC family transcriptional regulator [Hansschlegelia zhihuaiae]|uniref:AraC family transcriptional regulator n=1 Tax=Hansschlegelia zhihuaiae TaxID=405005 RepID=A0A4Q0MQA6_9HYPH|nr:AraC family transcriptional regulator [Hansschlegelia zhihuaiae]RXF75296.1 AraC family transcriptional regulator [Hansschlegelia zhihuaiae]